MKTIPTKPLALLASIASIGLAIASPMACAADKYAVVSAIGDELTIVTYQPSVGTNLDSNLRQVVPLADDSFDQTAATTAERAIHEVVPDAVTVVVAPPRDVFLRDDATVQQVDVTGDQLAAVEKSVGESGARYLMLISKSKGETRLAFRFGPRGQGRLFGIGFYFDRIKRVTHTDSGKTGRGFLAPYAYLTITLVDLQTGTVVRSKATNETANIPTAVSPTEMHPWDAVPPEDKVRALNGVIRKAVVETVPRVLGTT